MTYKQTFRQGIVCNFEFIIEINKYISEYLILT